ncbi:uncharacterized protein Tco025E_00647 [Trypanosoma conorhini]|uniref:Arrestin-like N-terminal domain-containing protein n=1 Tax=Trypanosoma conorhini TaxID=83891 RepID=A0A422QAT3_9TRYP|nr:uncharacterized protein Tco025E_00647 [Trypanosoma conorhini]RNF27093.1 hypothetical protein Tco025E_00647 [Trypanosoma conorhini]
MDFFRSTGNASLLLVFLERLNYLPGETLRAVAEVVVEKPFSYTSLEACITGEEVTRFGAELIKRIDTEARRTTFYRQNIILAGDPPNPETRLASDGEYSECSRSNTGSLTEASCSTTIMTRGLMPGTYNFPFSVRLPYSLPPSYLDIRNSGVSQLSYLVRVKLLAGRRLLAKHKTYFGLKVLPVNPRQWIHAHRTLSSYSNVPPQTSAAIDDASATGGKQNGSNSYAATKAFFIDHSLSLNNVIDSNAECNNGNLGDGIVNSSTGEQKLENEAEDISAEVPQRLFVDTWTVVGSDKYSDAGENAECAGVNGPSRAKKNSKGKSEGGHRASVEREGEADANEPFAAIFNETPPLEYHLEVPMHSIFKRGFVDVFLQVRQVIGKRGTPIKFRGIIENTKGLASVTKMSFRLVSQTIIKSRAEEQIHNAILVEKVIHEAIPRGNSYGISETQLVIPQSSPLTLLTPGYSSRVFLEIGLSYVQNLISHSGSGRVEIAVVDSFVDSEASPPLGQWTNYYLDKGLDKSACSSPDIICPFIKTGAMKVVQEAGDWCQDPASCRRSSKIPTREELTVPGRNRLKHKLHFDEVVYFAHAVEVANPLSSIPWEAQSE